MSALLAIAKRRGGRETRGGGGWRRVCECVRARRGGGEEGEAAAPREQNQPFSNWNRGALALSGLRRGGGGEGGGLLLLFLHVLTELAMPGGPEVCRGVVWYPPPPPPSAVIHEEAAMNESAPGSGG